MCRSKWIWEREQEETVRYPLKQTIFQDSVLENRPGLMPCPLHTSIPSGVSLLCKQDKLKGSHIKRWAEELRIVIQINARAWVTLFLHLAKHSHLMILSLYSLKDKEKLSQIPVSLICLLSSARENSWTASLSFLAKTNSWD